MDKQRIENGNSKRSYKYAGFNSANSTLISFLQGLKPLVVTLGEEELFYPKLSQLKQSEELFWKATDGVVAQAECGQICEAADAIGELLDAVVAQIQISEVA